MNLKGLSILRPALAALCALVHHVLDGAGFVTWVVELEQFVMLLMFRNDEAKDSRGVRVCGLRCLMFKSLHMDVSLS